MGVFVRLADNCVGRAEPERVRPCAPVDLAVLLVSAEEGIVDGRRRVADGAKQRVAQANLRALVLAFFLAALGAEASAQLHDVGVEPLCAHRAIAFALLQLLQRLTRRASFECDAVFATRRPFAAVAVVYLDDDARRVIGLLSLIHI